VSLGGGLVLDPARDAGPSVTIVPFGQVLGTVPRTGLKRTGQEDD
jgi:hypothetical protein